MLWVGLMVEPLVLVINYRKIEVLHHYLHHDGSLWRVLDAQCEDD